MRTNLSVLTKIILSNLFYIIPVGVLIYLLITVQTQEIDFALLEKRGNIQQRSLQKLVEHFGAHAYLSQKEIYGEIYGDTSTENQGSEIHIA